LAHSNIASTLKPLRLDNDHSLEHWIVNIRKTETKITPLSKYISQNVNAIGAFIMRLVAPACHPPSILTLRLSASQPAHKRAYRPRHYRELVPRSSIYAEDTPAKFRTTSASADTTYGLCPITTYQDAPTVAGDKQ
jgi:hypothetical protein